MTTSNPERSALDDYLDQFTPMDQVDMSARPKHDNHGRTIEYSGTTFKWLNNMGSTTQVQGYPERDAESPNYRVETTMKNQDILNHALAEKGLVMAIEDSGRALNMHGVPLSINTVELYAHPDLYAGRRINSFASDASHTIEGEYSALGTVNNRVLDIREVRAALDNALTQPEWSDISRIAQAHHERVFGDPRLGGHASRTVEEVGGVPDPADPRHLDYI